MRKIEMKRNTNGILALLTLVALVLSLAGQAQAASKSYQDKEHGFSFDYPEVWTMTDESLLGPMSVAMHAEPVDNFAANFNVVMTPPQGVAAVTEAELVKTYKSFMDDLKILSFKKDKFLGETCIVAEFRWTLGEHKIRQRQYLVDRKGKGYTLTFTALQSNFGGYEGAFKTILDSFKF